MEKKNLPAISVYPNVGGLKISEDPLKYLKERINMVENQMACCAQIDVCFCCDITGSMDPYIESVREKIIELSIEIQKFGNLLPRFAFVGYRDYEDAIEQFDIMDFTFDALQLKQHLKGIECKGGGDACEDAVGGLKIAAEKLSWQSKEKFLILVLDAPTHGKRYNEGKYDEHPNDDQNPLNLEKMCQYYSIAKIGLIVFQCANANLSMMLQVMKENYTTFDLSEYTFRLEVAVKGSTAAIQKSLLTHCSDSIRSLHSRADLKSDASIPQSESSNSQWNDMIMLQTFEFSVIGANTNIISFDGNNPVIDIKIGELVKCGKYNIGLTKIARGSFRDCYQLRDSNGKYIAKIANTSGCVRTISKIQGDLEMLEIGKFLAKKFNEELHNLVEVDFLPSYIFKVKDADIKNVKIFKGNSFFIAESFMNGKYVKYNNNSGWINESLKGSYNFKLMQAFSHYTFAKTQGTMIIIDLQGAHIGNKIYLTDPAIHSDVIKHNFGITNRRLLGIAEFFLSHECNEFCEKLKCKPCPIKKKYPPPSSSEYYAGLIEKLPKIPNPLEIPKENEEIKEGRIENPDLIVSWIYKDRGDGFIQTLMQTWFNVEKMKIIRTKTKRGERKTLVYIKLKDNHEIESLIEKYNGKYVDRLRVRVQAVRDNKGPKGNGDSSKGTPGKIYAPIHGASESYHERRYGEVNKPHSVPHVIEELKCDYHLKIEIRSNDAPGDIVEKWVKEFCDYEWVRPVKVTKPGKEKSAFEIRLKDPSKAGKIKELADLEHRQFNAIDVKYTIPGKPDPKDTLFVMLKDSQPEVSEINKILSGIAKYRKYALVYTNSGNTLLYVGLQNPSELNGIIQKFKDNINIHVDMIKDKKGRHAHVRGGFRGRRGHGFSDRGRGDSRGRGMGRRGVRRGRGGRRGRGRGEMGVNERDPEANQNDEDDDEM